MAAILSACVPLPVHTLVAADNSSKLGIGSTCSYGGPSSTTGLLKGEGVEVQLEFFPLQRDGREIFGQIRVTSTQGHSARPVRPFINVYSEQLELRYEEPLLLSRYPTPADKVATTVSLYRFNVLLPIAPTEVTMAFPDIERDGSRIPLEPLRLRQGQTLIEAVFLCH